MAGLLNKFGFRSRKNKNPDEVKSFKQTQQKEQAFDTRDRGLKEVPLELIIGSVGRYQDFDQRFHPKPHVASERFDTIKKAMREGQRIPPVKLYQIKNEYYALDGNHRISAAKELGWQEIKARILEFIPSSDTLENLIYRERAEFDDVTGLDHTINLTEVGQYDRLLDQIKLHQDYLADSEKTPTTIQAAAEDWYKTIYKPLIAIIEKGGLLVHFPGRTLADLYAYISAYQWERRDEKPNYGIGIYRQVPQNMEEFRNNMSECKETEYPEMLRSITTFVLMNVSAKKEIKIVDRLFALKEVEEVHSVHGSYDVVAKIVLKRDLLSSDAETIGDFVHNKVRQIPGVITTQTLIPGYSKEK